MDAYSTTSDKHAALSFLSSPICFIPLQLEDDMAVTMFTKGEQTYPEFLASMDEAIDRNPGIVFIVKPHPLSKLEPVKPKPNLIIAAREDNIHFLIDLASVTICYNSGVGLLSIIHEKPTITLGNAFYNLAGAGHHAASLIDGLRKFLNGEAGAPDPSLVRRLTAWFCFRKYSTFIATDNIREFSTRKAHGYKDILVTHFRFEGIDLKLGRQREIAPYRHASYAGSQLADTLGSASMPKKTPTHKSAPFQPRMTQIPAAKRFIMMIVRPFVSLIGTKKDVEKFNADPAGFFANLSNPRYRAIGRVLFPAK